VEHTVAYATFPNKGMAVVPHAILEVRSGTGETIWRFDRDGKKPTRAIPESVASDMAFMMSKVVEEGTAKRAALDGIPAAGKTGTTNGFRDAWFVGYTGNFSGAVWMGNDDYQPTKRMTGGSLPAQVWHNVMAYAHQDVELRQLAGMPVPQHTGAAVADAGFNGGNEPRPILLTRKGKDALVHVEKLLDDAVQAIAPQPAAGVTPATAPSGTPPAGAPAGTVGSIDDGRRQAARQVPVSVAPVSVAPVAVANGQPAPAALRGD